MPTPLPPRPNLRFLQLQAKSLLKAQRQKDPRACPTLRLLQRFRDAGDTEILDARVMLHEVQFALALHYGFKSWPDLRRHLQSLVREDDYSLDAIRLRPPDEIPEYAAAGVPLAIVAALNHAGEPLDFIDFAAASGWAFSFGYRYENISPAFMAVCGKSGRDGPDEIFSHLPAWLGYGYEMARVGDIAELWPFVVRHVDRGTPIISEHLDGGLIVRYREDDSGRQIEFDGPVGGGWMEAEKLQPFAVYVLKHERDSLPPRQIACLAIHRAAVKGAPHEWNGVPQGLAALEAYCADVVNPENTFSESEEWFCWAAFERLLARCCCAIWLNRVAALFDPPMENQLREAAHHYSIAFDNYEYFRREVMAGEPSTFDLRQRARLPKRIAVITPLLQSGIAAEKQGWAKLKTAAESMKSEHER